LIYCWSVGETVWSECDRGVVEPDEEEDGSGNVDEGVGSVDPVHQSRVAKEVLLDRRLPEDVEAFFEVD
jgi:hypothetical protein